MKTIQFNNNKYQCPQSWSEVSLEKQIKVTKDSEIFKTEATKRIALLSGYIGIDPDEMRKADIKKIMPMFNHLQFLKEPVPEKLVSEFVFKNETYYVAQNLITQEFQDFVSLENIMNDTKGSVLESLPYIIAILAKRKKESGEFESMDDYDVEERALEFKQLPISIANGIAVFFYSSEKLSTITTQLYSNPVNLIQVKAKEVLDTMKPQDGQGLLIRWLTGLSRSYIMSIKRNAEKYFTSTPAKFSSKNWRMTFKKWLSKKRRENKKK